jgi:quercetin dioxygenase-like cupin family protein
MAHDAGGDPPCRAHRFQAEADADAPGSGGVVVDLGSVDTGPGCSGVAWSLPHGGDLDVNLVRLDPGDAILGHVNDEVDVVVFVQSGRGQLAIDGTVHDVRADVLALVPRGSHRSVVAGGGGLTYLSIHRRRGPLAVSRRRTRDHHDPA